jgi:hypothetical protein
MTATSQTSTPFALNMYSYSVGVVSLTGSSLTTATFAVYGSADGGVTYNALAIETCATPGTFATTETATANGCYQVNLAGLDHIEYVTSGTFTATSITLTLTASPNAQIGRSSGGDSGGDTINSPNGTINVGGTSADTTLDVANPLVSALQPQNKYAMVNTYAQIAAMDNYTENGGTPVQMTIMFTGDSTTGFHNAEATCALIASHGGVVGNTLGIVGGVQYSYLPNCSQGDELEGTTLTDVTLSTNDYAHSPTGGLAIIAAGGSIIYTAISNPGYCVPASYVDMFYTEEPGDGTIGIFTSADNGATWVSQYSGSAAAGSLQGAVWNHNFGVLGCYELKVTATGGPVHVLGVGTIDKTHNGFVLGSTGVGGQMLSDSVSTSAAVLNPWYAEVNPNLVMYEGKDNGINSDCTMATTAAPTVFQPFSYWLNLFGTEWRTANALTDIEFTGSYPLPGDSNICIGLTNSVQVAWAAANRGWYEDLYTPLTNAQMQALGLIDGSVHQTEIGQRAYAEILSRDLGFNQLASGAETKPVANWLTATISLWLGSSSANAPSLGRLCTSSASTA